MTYQRSEDNVFAALASFFVPGLGQWLQGRKRSGWLFLLAAAVLWVFMLGWVMHCWSIVDVALYRPGERLVADPRHVAGVARG